MKQFTAITLLVCFSTIVNAVNFRYARHIRQGNPCPADWDIGPCTCGGYSGVPTIDCSAISNTEELVKIFKTSPNRMNFRGVDIHGSKSLVDLPDNTFGTNTLHLFMLDGNHIQTVGEKAFSGSEETVDLIRLSDNDISEFPFASLTSLKSLRVLALANNKITKIPENALSNENLQMIDLSGNAIDTIGSNAFAQLPSLQKLDLSDNKLGIIREKTFSNDKLSNPMELVLANNSITQIDDGAFSGLKLSTLDLSHNQLKVLKENIFSSFLKADSTVQKILLEGNSLACDNEEMEWIKNLPKEALSKVHGFKCESGKKLDELH